MSDDSPDAGDGTTTTSFEEWLTQHAASQGISREELFERLISSYWTLNELTQLLDDSERGTSALTDEAVGGAEEPTPFDADAVGNAATGTDGRRSPNHGSEEKPEQSASLAEQFESLEERVDDLQAEIEAETERGQSLDEVTAAVATRLTEIEAELDEVTAAVDTTQESLTEQYDSLTARIDSLESVVDRKHAKVTSEQSDLAAQQDEMRSRIDAEFGNLETILKYLVSQTDELEADLTVAEKRSRDAVSSLQWERDRLQTIKRDAADLDVHEGACESCEETIDLDLLSRPYCPHCETTLSGVEGRKKWLFLSDAVVTSDSETLDGSLAHDPDVDGASIDPRSRDSDPQSQRRESRQRPPQGRGASQQPPQQRSPQQSPQQRSPQPDAERRDAGGRPARDPSAASDETEIKETAQRGDGGSETSTAKQNAESSSGHTADDSAESASPFGDLSELERNDGS